jgi:hypothetical protein
MAGGNTWQRSVVGEMLLNTPGKVARVWTIREVNFNPPFPAFNQAIVDGLRVSASPRLRQKQR